MPMCHVGGLSILVRCAVTGMTLVQHERFDPARVDRSLRQDGIGFVSLVPTMLALVLDVVDAADYPDALRAVVLGGGRLRPSLVERAGAHRMPIVATFGMTETAAQVTASRSGDAVAHPGSAGHPLDGVELSIDMPDEDGVGEIVVRAPQLCGGYFRDPERSALLYRGGSLHTGDLGRIDEQGRLWVETRRTDLIVTGGENVSPEEVEEVLTEHPRIDQAAVFGVEDPLWGQVVAAVVVPAGDRPIDAAALESWCRDRLAAYKIPRRWSVRERLPRTVSGKLQRGRLTAPVKLGVETRA
jgi:O-succinylbenzoic acid--CoA ligase